MSILTHILGQDGDLVTATVDKYGDQIPSSEATIKCRFRYITQVNAGSHAEDTITSDAIIWFEPDADVIEGSLIKIDSVYWRVDRLVKARRLVGNTVQFLKCFVNRHELGDFS